MVGLDRAACWFKLDAQPELLLLGVQKRFSSVNVKKLAGNTQTFKINQEGVNEIRIKEKSSYTFVKIDFSYSRNSDYSNIYPLDNEIGKILVEEKICQIVRDISLEQVTRNDMIYDFIEICTQEQIGSFYSYHNIISCFYKALKRHYKSRNTSRFEDYDKALDKFYSTGFIFDINPGWKMRLYNKTLESNKKTNNKTMGANLRLEHKLTRNALEAMCRTARCVDLTLDTLTEKVIKKISEKLFLYLKAELERDVEILVKSTKNFTSRSIPILVRDLQEHILDEVVISNIITQNSNVSARQKIRYRNKVKESLKEYEARGSPRRSNFKNIPRLNLFINKIIHYEIEVKCKYNLPLTFNAIKK